MSFLSVYTRDQLREIAVEAYNAAALVPVATDAGSGLGSFFDGDSLLGVVEQRQLIYVSTIARLSTIPPNADGSPNPDVDSYISPFIGARGGQQYASGPCVFASRASVLTQLVIPVGAVVQAQATGLLYTVIADPANSNYSTVLNGYPIIVGTNTVTATVQCQTAGTAGNAQAGQINALYGGPGQTPTPPGISSVSNPLAFVTGSAYESDASYISRFSNRMRTGQGGTWSAIAAAIGGIAPNITWALADRLDDSGNTVPAYYTVVVATLGQTAATPSSLISQVTAALQGNPPTILPVTPVGMSYQVIGPSILAVNVAATIKVSPGSTQATVQANASAAVQQFIGSIGLPGFVSATSPPTTLAYLQIAATLYGVPGVARVDNLVLTLGGNDYASDLTATYAQLFAPGAMTFAMSN